MPTPSPPGKIRSFSSCQSEPPSIMRRVSALTSICREAYCDMKIKEKGLSGKAADLRRQNIAGSGRKGFNAFAEMAAKEKGGERKGKDKPKGEVYLEFLGNKIRVHDEDGGSVKPEDVPLVKGASLKFDGAGDDVSFDEIKVYAPTFRAIVRWLTMCYRAHLRSALLVHPLSSIARAIAGALSDLIRHYQRKTFPT